MHVGAPRKPQAMWGATRGGETDYRHRRLLRVRRERPRDCCAAEQRDELAAPHALSRRGQGSRTKYSRSSSGQVHRSRKRLLMSDLGRYC
jgi:hypothetical protein